MNLFVCFCAYVAQLITSH